MKKRLQHHLDLNLTVRLEWQPRDLWLGAYWERRGDRTHLWLVLPPFGLPCLPIHASWDNIKVEEPVMVHVFNQEYVLLWRTQLLRGSAQFKDMTRVGVLRVPDVGSMHVLTVQPFGERGDEIYVQVQDTRIAPEVPDMRTIGDGVGYTSWESYKADYAEQHAPRRPEPQWGKDVQP